MTKSKETEADKAKNEAEKAELTAEQKAELTAAPPNAKPSPGIKPSAEREHVEATGPEVESVRVLIKLNELTTIPKRVFVHEIAILQTLHGEEKIEVVEGSELMKPLIGEAPEELDRLLRVYGRKGAKAVTANYHNARDLADAIGIKAPKTARATKKGLASSKQSAQRGAGVE